MGMAELCPQNWIGNVRLVVEPPAFRARALFFLGLAVSIIRVMFSNLAAVPVVIRGGGFSFAGRRPGTVLERTPRILPDSPRLFPTRSVGFRTFALDGRSGYFF
jgi:hypothetical protein